MGAASRRAHPPSRVHGRAKRHPTAVSNPEGPTMTKRVLAFCIALLISFAVFLVVALWGATFGIDGSTSRALVPGATVPVNVRISNPHFYPITVRDLKVSIASVTPARKGDTCSASNYTVTQGRSFAAQLAPFSSASMKTIQSATSEWPSVHLTADRTKIERGCQGATVTLAYSATGNWWTR
jgi:hypothetical protein